MHQTILNNFISFLLFSRSNREYEHFKRITITLESILNGQRLSAWRTYNPEISLPLRVYLPTVGNDWDDVRPAAFGADLVDSKEDLEAIMAGGTAEHDMLLVPFFLFGKGEEELRAV